MKKYDDHNGMCELCNDKEGNIFSFNQSQFYIQYKNNNNNKNKNKKNKTKNNKNKNNNILYTNFTK